MTQHVITIERKSDEGNAVEVFRRVLEGVDEDHLINSVTEAIKYPVKAKRSHRKKALFGLKEEKNGE